MVDEILLLMKVKEKYFKRQTIKQPSADISDTNPKVPLQKTHQTHGQNVIWYPL